MQKLLLIVGIAIIIVGVIALLFSALQRNGYYNLHDAEAERYIKLRRRMIRFFVIGIVLVVVGIACLIIRNKSVAFSL